MHSNKLHENSAITEIVQINQNNDRCKENNE